MKLSFRLIVLLGLCLFMSFARADKLPRMWKVKRLDAAGVTQTIHILGVSHNGLELEYDAYFYDKVLPVFDQSSMLFSESALMNPFTVPQCEVPLERTEENLRLIAELRANLVSQYSSSSIRDLNTKNFTKEEIAEIREAFVMTAKMRVERLSEYGMLLALMQADRTERPSMLGGKMTVLGFLRERSNTMPRSSVDTQEEMVSAFCKLKKERAKYIREQAKNYSSAEWSEAEADAFKRAERALADSIVKGKVSAFFNEGLEFEQAYVCERNRNWLKLISSSRAGDKSFFVLGVAHLLPADWRPKNCPDLLTLLRKEAFEVELVH